MADSMLTVNSTAANSAATSNAPVRSSAATTQSLTAGTVLTGPTLAPSTLYAKVSDANPLVSARQPLEGQRIGDQRLRQVMSLMVMMMLAARASSRSLWLGWRSVLRRSCP